MADVIGLSDVSSPDTGKGSKLKTGGRRSYNMPGKKYCAKIKDPKERSDCENYKGKYAKKKKSLLEQQYEGLKKSSRAEKLKRKHSA